MYSYLEEININNLSKEIYNAINNIQPDFEIISSLLQNKSFLNNNKDFLQLIGINLNPYQLRMFLTILMIKYCPNEILNEIKDVEENLIMNGNILLDSYIKLLHNLVEIESFKQKLDNFLMLFQSWKEQDKNKFIFVLSSSYNELKTTKKMIESKKFATDEEKEIAKIWIDEIEKQKKSLEKAVYQIGGELGIEKMLDGSFWLDIISIDFKNSIEVNFKKSFRNKLIEEIGSDKCPFTIIKCLKEIKNSLSKNYNIDKKLKIEILNFNLPEKEQRNLIKYNLEIFKNELNIDYKLDDNKENIIDFLLMIYDRIGK